MVRAASVSDVHELGLRRKDGTAVPVLVSASPTLDADGRYQGLELPKLTWSAR